MPNHFSKNKTQTLPIMKTNWKSNDNTNENRNDFFEQMHRTAEYSREIDHENERITIWFMTHSGDWCAVSMYYRFGIGYSTITIENAISKSCHKFSSEGFSASVRNRFLTPEDDEQQRIFNQEKQKREDDLQTKHKLGTCGGTFNCKICYSDASRHQILHGYGT